jgi:glycosyltransferase involved in cell wall biosynthesis
VLVLTNMYPTRAEPWLGCFVADQVEDLRRLGIDVTVLSFDARSKKREYLAAVTRLRRALRRDRYDVVHAHYGLSGAVACTQLNSATLTTFHGSDVWIPWQRNVSRIVARRTHVIAVAPVVVTALGLRGAPVIPCAVDLDLFTPEDQARARRALGWRDDGVCVLFPASRADGPKVGNKRADVFDAMVARLRRRAPDAFAVSLDGLSRREVALAMNAADVTVLTSMREGAPIAVKESLACGTPVVSTAVGDVPALIAGLPGCAVVARDPEALAGAVERAVEAGRSPRLRDAVAAFAREQVARKVLGVYETVAARR